MYYVASNLKVPLSAGKFSQGKWGATHYAHGYYPDSAFEETPADVKTWTGSDDSHYFTSKDGDAAEVVCVRRRKLCGCDPCFRHLYHNCKSNAVDNGLWYGYRGELQLGHATTHTLQTPGTFHLTNRAEASRS